MLNWTRNPFLFSFNPFFLTPPQPPLQKMEMVEGGTKTDDFKDFTGEDFFVEDLFVDGGDGFFETETHVAEVKEKTPSTTPISTATKEVVKPTAFASVDDFVSVPADEMADLEWLSHFVEDSFSGYSMTCQVTGKQAELALKNPSQATTPEQTQVTTKHARTGGRVWLSGLKMEPTSSMSSFVVSDTWLLYRDQNAESVSPMYPLVQTAKKQKKRVSNIGVHATVASRRCTHCGVQKTPQWRAGPHGDKTLCNACGVRFKSGRLFPEYRPASCPTFSSEMHSNNHRKVLEMRMKKDAEMEAVVSV